MFYNENCLIAKIPPKIPPNPPLQRGGIPFSQGGYFKLPLYYVPAIAMCAGIVAAQRAWRWQAGRGVGGFSCLRAT